MSRLHVDHRDIVRFAQDRVNLSREKANEYRAQARRLRERLGGYLKEHPGFTLKKMLLSGSLAKGTALRSLNDIDVACYISRADAPSDVAQLLRYLVKRLRNAFPNFSPDQVQAKTYSVTVSSPSSACVIHESFLRKQRKPAGRRRTPSSDDAATRRQERLTLGFGRL